MIATPLLLLILLIVDSLHFVFARMLLPQLAPALSVMLVLAIATVEVLVYGLVTRRLKFHLPRPQILLFTAIGFLVATSTAINYEAVAFIDPGTASLLAQTGTIFGLGLGIFWLKDGLQKHQVIGAALAVLGVFVMEYRVADYLRIGSLLVLVSTFLYALHSALAKRYSQDLDFLTFFFYRLLFTTAFLVLFSIGRGALTLPASHTWPLLLLVGTTDVVISRTLYYLALRRLSLSLHTIALTLSPLVAIMWAIGLFGEYPGLQQVFGGLIVLAGVLTASLLKNKSQN